MSYKKTYAFIKGSWDGIPESSNFIQEATVFSSPEEFLADYKENPELSSVINEYVASGDIIVRTRDLSEDGKVKINTTEFIDEAAHDACSADSRWDGETEVTKSYSVEKASTPEDINTFDEPGRIYYHSVAHLF